MGTGVTGAAQSLSSHPSAGREPLEERGVGEGEGSPDTSSSSLLPRVLCGVRKDTNTHTSLEKVGGLL